MTTRFYIRTALLFASAFLLLVACGEDKKEGEEKVDTTPDLEVRKTGELKIAYYDQDSLLLHFDYYVEKDSLLTKKGLAFQGELQRRSQQLEAYIARMDAEARKGLMSEIQMQQVQQEIQRRQGEIMQYQESQGAKIEQETAAELEAIGNKIQEFGKQYCEENGIDILMIKAQGGQFNYIHASMDVTKEFTEYVNQREEELQKSISK